MTVKRIVDTKFWNDETVLDTYSVEDKYFLLYLMTNTMTTQLGIYRLPKKYISFHTGYTKEVVEVLLQRFQDKYKNISYNHKTQEIAVLNSLKYSIVKGGKPVSDLLIRELSKIEDTQLIVDTYLNMLDWWKLSARSFDKTIQTLFEDELAKRKVPKEKLNDNVNDNVNDNDNEESYHESYDESSISEVKDNIPYKEIIEYLNFKTDRSYRTVESNKKPIRARFNEGYELADFKKVIDNMCVNWSDTDMAQYLRPQTLFGTKFDNYLNAKIIPKKSNNAFLDALARGDYD
mgnify:CR=1 FL=1